MKIRSFILGAALTLLALPALADGIAGKWNASVETPQGPFALVFEFAAEAGKLTGTLSNDMMGAVPISDGVVNGNDVSFKLSLQDPGGGSMVISYRGVVKGDDLELVSKFETPPPGGGPAEQALVAKRAK